MKRQRGEGSVYKQPESQFWWLRYYRHGHLLRESSGTTDEAKAWKILKKRVAQVTTGTHPGLEIERVKVDELAEDTLRDYRINRKKSIGDVEARWRLHLAPFFSGMRAAHVTSKHLAQYVDQRQQESATNATVNRELAALKRMFSLGHKATPKKVLHMPSFPHLKENNVRQGFLEDALFQRLVEGAELWFRTLVECAASIGWRRHELLALLVKQIDLEHRVLRLEPGTTKNDEGREAPMTDAMLQLLSACMEGKGPEDRVFTRPDGSSVESIRDTWAKACCAAGLGAMYCMQCDETVANEKLPQCPGCGRRLTTHEQSYRGLLFHDLRRTAARNLRRAGIPESMIKQIGGWKTTSVFHRYAIVDRRDMATAMRQFEQHQRELAEARAKNEHSSSIVGDFEAEKPSSDKLQ
jgi:integrase